MQLTFFFTCLLFVLPCFATINLESSFKLAMKQSEDYASQQEGVFQSEEKLSQARGALLPTVNGVGTFLKQEQGSITNVAPSTQNTIKLVATQPLFRGFREYAALRQTKKQIESSEFSKGQALTQLFLDVTQSFYQVLQLEQDRLNLKTEIEVNQKRLDEVNAFRKIGRSRESEALTLNANIATLEAQDDLLKSQIDSARNTFVSLTGQEKSVVLQDDEPDTAPLKELSHYLSKIEDRPDVKAMAMNAQVADEGVSIARGGHLPMVDLLGNYYFQRPGALSNVNWDVQLAVTIPLFQGGVVQSQVRQAASFLKQNDLAFAKTKRLAQVQIETLHQQIQSDVSQLEKQKKALELTTKNYQAELRDYRLGLVTNLEVLQALTTSQETKRTTDRTRFQLKVDTLRLQAAVAERPKR